MIIVAYFTVDNVAETGLSPTIDIWELDSDTQKVIAQPMIETNHAGFYKYDFSTIDTTKSYTVSCDGGEVLDSFDRYTYGVITSTQAKQPVVSFGNGS